MTEEGKIRRIQEQKKLEEERKKQIEELKRQRQPPSQNVNPYKKESPIMKNLLGFILIAAIIFGIYKYGPTMVKNAGKLLPEDFMSSRFMLYINCIPKAFSVIMTGDTETIGQCFSAIDKEPEPTSRYEVLDIKMGDQDGELLTPKGNREYTLPIEITNLDPEKLVTVSVEGFLDYEEKIETPSQVITQPQRVNLFPTMSSFEIEDDPVELNLVSNTRVDCSVSEYDSVTVETTYSDYSTSKSSDYVVAKSKEHVKIAKPSSDVKTSGPVDIGIDFSPNSYYPYTLEGTLSKVIITLTFKNRLKDTEAVIKGFEIDRINDNGRLLSLDSCECLDWGQEPLTISKENERVNIPGNLELYNTLTSKVEHICECTYDVDVSGVEDLDAYKTLTFNATIYYDGIKSVTRNDIPDIDRNFCGARSEDSERIGGPEEGA